MKFCLAVVGFLTNQNLSLGPFGEEKQVDTISRTPSVVVLDDFNLKPSHEGEEEKKAFASLVSDLIWADPAVEERETTLDSLGFGKSPRGGAAVCFGNKAIEIFLRRHNFTHILRAHEAHTEGFAISKSARIITIFSTSQDHGLGDVCGFFCILYFVFLCFLC